MLDLHKTLGMVEEAIAAMKQRQSTVLAGYQQQVREDIAKKFEEADRTLMEATEQKAKEINDLEQGKPFLITSARKISSISVKRLMDESSLTINIEPIIYPTPFNLKFIFDEPSISFYSPSLDKGTFSANSSTAIRATDVLQTLDLSELETYVELWITHKADDSFVKKLKNMQKKISNVDGSVELAMESMLAMSYSAPKRALIYMCENHENEPTHKHEKTVPPSAVKGLLKHHLKLNQ